MNKAESEVLSSSKVHGLKRSTGRQVAILRVRCLCWLMICMHGISPHNSPHFVRDFSYHGEQRAGWLLSDWKQFELHASSQLMSRSTQPLLLPSSPSLLLTLTTWACHHVTYSLLRNNLVPVSLHVKIYLCGSVLVSFTYIEAIDVKKFCFFCYPRKDLSFVFMFYM